MPNKEALAEVKFSDIGLKSQENADKTQDPLWVDRDEKQVRYLKQKQKRIKVLLDDAKRHHEEIQESILLHEGHITTTKKDDLNKVEQVMPVARSFVEAKTAEEIKATSSFVFKPKKEKIKALYGKLMQDVDAHVKRVTNYKTKRHSMIRKKNIMGVSIKRKGYRKIMRWDKIPVNIDDDGRPTEWKLSKVPIYDDIFEDVISPIQFAIDPNATTLNDAMDCYYYHIENIDTFRTQYGNDKRWINVDKVKAGAKFKFNDEGEYVFDRSIENNSVIIEEYFNKELNEWVVIANGVLITPIFEAEGPDGKKDIYGYPLPDLHGELPFVAYHNHSSFLVESFARTFVNDTVNGEELADMSRRITGNETFWTKGDPIILRDLITLETGLTQAMFRNAKLASQVIIATDRGFKFKTKRWKSGDQAVGMKGRFEVAPLGQSQQTQIQPLLDFLFQMKVLAIGIDPRNIAQDTPTKSATEAAIIQETSMGRLNENIQFNVENGEMRDGKITLSLMNQHYSRPEIVRITDDLRAEDLAVFDDFEEIEMGPDKDGKKIMKKIAGKKYRTIITDMKLEEQKDEKTGKYLLTVSENGVNSFLSRPEHLRILDVVIDITTQSNLGEVKAIKRQQSIEEINMFLQLYQATIPPGDGIEPAISKDDLPPIKDILSDYMHATGRSVEWHKKESDGMSEFDEIRSAMQSYMGDRQSLTDNNVLNSTPNVNENIPSITPE